MKRFRREIYSLVTVGLIVAALILSIPREAFRFRARNAPSGRNASAAFVILTDDERNAALKAAKTAWQSDVLEESGSRIRLPLGELPEEPPKPFLDETDLPCGTPPVTPAVLGLSAWGPSLAAPPPVRLEAEPEEKPKPAFSREEMLKM